MVRFAERRVREGFVCVADVRVTMIQNFASLGGAYGYVDMWFLVYIESNEVISGLSRCLLGRGYT